MPLRFNDVQLRASRALWRRREKKYWRKWYFHRYKSKLRKTDPDKNKAYRSYYWGLYTEALGKRVARDQEIAHRTREVKTVSDAGVNLVARFEGFRSHPYRDAVGVWTIGYGETKGIGPNTTPWSQTYAKSRLRKRLNADYVPAVLRASRRKLTQNELDGFASFVYNCGPGAVGPNTTVGRELRAGHIREAADALLAWDKAGGRPLAGLTRRRREERALILR